MSDRWVFLTSFVTVVLIVAGAFVVPPLFYFELFKSLIFLVVALLAFFGEDRYSYMLGIVAPPIWFILDIVLGGGFFDEFGVLGNYIAGKSIPRFESPLHGIAILTEMALIVFSLRAWRKEVGGPGLGKTVGICVAISVAYCLVLTGWVLMYHPAGPAARIP